MVIITMARKTAANLNMHCVGLRIWLSVGCKRRFYFLKNPQNFHLFDKIWHIKYVDKDMKGGI